MASLTKSDMAAPIVEAACSMSSLAVVEYAEKKCLVLLVYFSSQQVRFFLK
jgi:hypothetical protein